MTNSNISVHFGKVLTWLVLNGKIIAFGEKENNLYTYISFPIEIEDETVDLVLEPSGPTLCHHRLVHTSYHVIENMRKLQMAEKFQPGVHHGSIPQFLSCPYGKQTRSPFQKVEKLPENIGDIIVSDLCGPFEASVGNFRYFVTWIDLKTRLASIDFINNKECHTVTASFGLYMAWLLRQKSATVKRIRSDNGGEYIGKEFQDVCAKSGIIHETTSPHTPEHNGIAERYNRTLQEGALTIRHDAGLLGKFWVSAMHTVNFVKNRILHSRIGKSPYEAFWNTKPRIDWM
jgi:Integrase core domain